MNYDGFLKQLKKGNLQDVYYFHGEEKLLKKQALGQLEKLLLPAGLEDFNKDILEGDSATPKLIAETAMNLPFMAEKRVLIVKPPYPFVTKGKDAVEPLLDYLEHPNPQCCLIFYAEEPLKGNTKLGKRMKDFEVEFAPLKSGELNQWIQSFLSEQGRDIHPAALGYLSSVNKLDLQSMEQELQKLVLYVPEGETIQLHHVEEIITKTLESNVFGLVDSLSSRRANDALQMYKIILAEGEPLIRLIIFLENHFRRLLLLKDLKQQGYSEGDIKDKTGLHPFAVKKGIGQAANFTEDQIIQILNRLLEIEVELKSTSTDKEILLERFILELCYEMGGRGHANRI